MTKHLSLLLLFIILAPLHLTHASTKRDEKHTPKATKRTKFKRHSTKRTKSKRHTETTFLTEANGIKALVVLGIGGLIWYLASSRNNNLVGNPNNPNSHRLPKFTRSYYNADAYEMLEKACQSNNLETVKSLAQDPNIDFTEIETPFYLA